MKSETILQQRRVGIALVAGSAVCWSLAGLFVRLADLDTATLLVWSAVAACLGIGGARAWQLGRAFPSAVASLGLPELLYIVVGTACSFSFVISVQYTSVANVMVIYAMLPFLATAIAYAWLRELVSRRFALAGMVATSGAAVTAGAAMSVNDVTGLLAAFVMTATYAGQLVIVKRYPHMDILLVTAISAGLSAVVAAPMAAVDVPSFSQLAGCILYGLVPYGLGTALALMGGRRIKSGEAGFVAMLDVVLAPLWVWILINEQPTVQALMGGAIVLAAVTWYLSSEEREIAAEVTG